jgi:periplasmic divalent cation tolerance protein
VKGKKRNGNKKKTEAREIVIFITASSVEEGQKIAYHLVAEHLVACVNIVSSIQSVFYWQEKVCDEQEVLLICKSRGPLFQKISRRVKELHTYTVPEIIALPIVQGSKDYLRWIDEVTRVRRREG